MIFLLLPHVVVNWKPTKFSDHFILFYFWGQFCVVAKSDNDPEEGLAKFGYKAINMKL
jgi:hypothetical protein